MTRKQGDLDCEHEWVYSNKVVLTNPMTFTKICKKCGRVEEEREEQVADRPDFDDYYDKFHGNG